MGKNIIISSNALTLRIDTGIVISPKPIVISFAMTVSTCPEILLSVKEQDEIWIKYQKTTTTTTTTSKIHYNSVMIDSIMCYIQKWITVNNDASKMDFFGPYQFECQF